ncbi:hypothetical protein ABEB36_015235 [Hypothenemus hampei]|uniref:Uncharacterized protein n=1 Tax=Hypothenemus hampei TaxID=57062 RepID=A0ABD1E132_HYPHA
MRSLFIVVFFGSNAFASGNEFITCHVKSDNFQDCLNKAIEDGIKQLKNGSSYYNLAPLDPHSIPSMTVGSGSGIVHLEQNYEDIVVYGLTDLSVSNAQMNFETLILKYNTMCYNLTQTSYYDIKGKLMLLPVHGRGSCMLTLKNVLVDHELEFQLMEKSYYHPKSYKLKLHPEHAAYHFENLFDGNKILGDNVNNVINQEWKAVFEDVGLGYEKAWAQVFLQYAIAIFQKIPANKFFIQ